MYPWASCHRSMTHLTRMVLVGYCAASLPVSILRLTALKLLSLYLAAPLPARGVSPLQELTGLEVFGPIVAYLSDGILRL